MSQAQVVASKLRKDHGSVSGFQGTRGSLGKGPAAMARWAHPFPSRTRKLSTAAAKVAPMGENSALPGFFFSGPFRPIFCYYFILTFLAVFKRTL